VRVGKAASEYETPMMLKGTDCKLKEKLKTEIEPEMKKEAKEMRKSSASSFEDTVIVLGRDVKTIFFIKLHLTGKRNFGNIFSLRIKGICMAKCKNAPRATPKPKPTRPKTGYRKMIPNIMPML